MKSLSKSLGLMLISASLWGGNAPVALSFAEGEQFEVALSRLNFNRIFVEGEKIVQLAYPENAFTVNKTAGSTGEMDSSAYLKPMADIPLTVFFVTDANHHFSLTIRPQETEGKTIRLVPKGVEKKTAFKHPEAGNEAEEVIERLMAGDIPDGFKAKPTPARPFYVNKILKLNLKKAFEHQGMSAYIYTIENKSNAIQALNTALFANQSALSLRLSKEAIAPNETALLYGLYQEVG